MAHELAVVNGKAAMAYFGPAPWHGLGTQLENPATAEEAIVAAGLDYEVELTPLMTLDGIPVPQRKAVVRDDTLDVLGVVGNSYQPVQNRECFGFLDGVVGEGELRYHTAGALRLGERVWMLAKLPDEIRVKDSDDITEKFLLLSNSHDGSSSLRVFFTPIRVVCANTLSIAEREGQRQGISIVHKGNPVEKVRQAQTVLGLADRFYRQVSEKMEFLARHYPSREQLEDFFSDLYPDREESRSRRAANVRDQLFKLFESGMGQEIPEIRHSTWAALNAVTEYIDHHRPTRVKNELDRADQRLDAIWFGSGARLKERAWELALQMAS